MVMVVFTYYTGITTSLFAGATLWGSWNSAGAYSGEWQTVPMQLITAEDGCTAFQAQVNFDGSQTGWWFHWGVALEKVNGESVWGIVTEQNNATPAQRYRSFALEATAGPQQQAYYLSQGRRLGAQKIYNGAATPQIRFSVWAPNAQKVEVVMGYLFHAADPQQLPLSGSIAKAHLSGGYIADTSEGIHPQLGPFPLTRNAEGIWSSEGLQLGIFASFDHCLYMFRLWKKGMKGPYYRTCLYSRCQVGYGDDRPKGAFTGPVAALDGTVGCSVVIDPDRVTALFEEPLFPETKWVTQEDFWKEERFFPPRVTRVEDLVIYELHLGALGYGKPDTQPGTVKDAIQLLPYLRQLGVNAIELLPLSEFGGGVGNWGYSTSHYFAIEYSGGGRDQFKWLIRECHRAGIAVIMDVVYNHYTHDAERAQHMYDTNEHDTNSYYWYEGKPWYYAFPEGGYIENDSTGWAPNYQEQQVRSLFISSAVALALEFNVDGFRLDQTTSIASYNRLIANKQPAGQVNETGKQLLRELVRTLKMVKPGIMLMAEDHSNSSELVTPVEQGGIGFDAVWYADFYHHLVGDTGKDEHYAKLLYTAGQGGDGPLAMDYFAGALLATAHQKVAYHESHDEAGNGQGTHRNIVVAGTHRFYAEARCRFIAAVTLLSAGTPMFFSGEEVLAAKPFIYGHVLNSREDLAGLQQTSGKAQFACYQALIKLRTGSAALRSRNIAIVYTHNQNRLIVFRRWLQHEEYLVIGCLHNRGFVQNGYRFLSDYFTPGNWQEVFNSNAALFGGDNAGNQGAVLRAGQGVFTSMVPANSVLVFKKV